ncbi:MAG: hypothetical protein ACI36V_01705 [Coriobacteriales bacterium]
MGICHYCFNCGRCRGEKPKAIVVPTCMACGFRNERGVETCAECGNSLVLQPGVTNTVGKRL